MLTEERLRKLMNDFAMKIQGGVCKDFMQIIDEFIDEGIMTDEEFKQNETQICYAYDNDFFTCEGSCGWTMPMDELGTEDGLVCHDCCGEGDD